MLVKKDIVDKASAECDVTKKDTAAIVDAAFMAIAQALVDGEEVRITNFGTFATSVRAARTVANPQDRTKTVEVPAKTAVKFKPSKILKDSLNA